MSIRTLHQLELSRFNSSQTNKIPNLFKQPAYNLEQLNNIAQSSSQKERVAEDYSEKLQMLLSVIILSII